MAGGLALLGAGGVAGSAITHQRLAQEAARTEATRAQAQRELNAIAARVGELQAQANRLNALGERLTRMGGLKDGEFDFQRPVGVGGDGEVRDMRKAELGTSLDGLARTLGTAGEQLTVLDSLLTDRQLSMDAVPSRVPVLNSYVTSGFGNRADPIVGGGEFHKGIDFSANTGDPVLAVADGVVSFVGVRSGYGNVVEIDHGNGYVTRYAHNSRLERRQGELVRAGEEIAKAGSTGRSTGAHVHLEVWQDGRVVNPRPFLQGALRG
ncbi:M23 family metallopeptidase [Cognatilysobacter segetis]|uniref:M23 family metallopeptidase n=1 Tax=Cognatilysobacter segetis TaxID=2492394 RepID=UPI001EE4D0BB|nr:M23 family metallopeptidase [Lysobacter segetis]